MKWEQGRQQTGYLKKLLLQGSWWDLWLLKYPPLSSIRPHIDPVTRRRHFRLNFCFWGEQTFWSANPPILNLGRLVIFRPDIDIHGVRISFRSRYVLSLGWTLRP